jgi:serine/threonine protein kinase
LRSTFVIDLKLNGPVNKGKQSKTNATDDSNNFKGYTSQLCTANIGRATIYASICDAIHSDPCNPGLCPQQTFGGNLSKLEVASFSALAALHSQNVCHNDIHCGNILWRLGGDKVWFVDFGSGLWPSQYPELNMAYKRSHDAACLRASLEDLGWIDPRPQRKPPCTGVEHCLRQCGCTSFSDDDNDP